MKPAAALIPRGGQSRLVYVSSWQTDIRVRLEAAREAMRQQPQTRVAVERHSIDLRTK